MACNMDRWIDKTAIVTGGSKGIGYAIVEKLVDAGVNVVAVARGKEKLDEVAKQLKGRKGNIFTFVADMGKEEDILDLFKWVKANMGPVHILVNNASIHPQANLTEGDTKVWKSVIDVQILGLCIATREAVQDMRANKVDGHIIHMNAIDGHKIVNYPNSNVISASKFAITALTETLRNELNLFKDKIKISSISPGIVNTDGVRAILAEMSQKFPAEAIKEFVEAVKLEPEDVAEAAIYILSTPPRVQIHDIMIKPIGENV